MLKINSKTAIKSLASSLHEAMVSNPELSLSDFQELMSNELCDDSWTALLLLVEKTEFEDIDVDVLKTRIADSSEITSYINMNHSVESMWDIEAIIDTVNDTFDLDIKKEVMNESFCDWLLAHFNTCNQCGAHLDEMNYCTDDSCLMYKYTQDSEFDESLTYYKSLNSLPRRILSVRAKFTSRISGKKSFEEFDFGYVLSHAKATDGLETLMQALDSQSHGDIQDYFNTFLDSYKGGSKSLLRIVNFRAKNSPNVEIDIPNFDDASQWIADGEWTIKVI